MTKSTFPPVLCLLFCLHAFCWSEGSGAVNGDNSLDLLSCVRLTLEKDPEIAIQWEAVRSQQGQVQAEIGVFDYELLLTGEGGEERSPLNLVDDRLVGNISFTGDLVKLFRSGLEMSGGVSLVRQDFHIPGESPQNSGRLRVDFTYPLLKGRGRDITEASRKIAEINYQASSMDYRHTLSQRVLAVTQAYWDYLAAVKSLEIALESEDRSKKLMEDTLTLIEADEAPRNEMIQLQADLATKRAARVTSNNLVFQTRWNLGLIMGVSPEEIRALPQPSTAFPKFRELSLPSAEMDAAFVREALGGRWDYRAARLRQGASAKDRNLARDGLKPNLDLTAGAGYNSLEVGGDLEAFYQALYNNIPGASYSISLKYRLPLKNNVARGRLVQSEAAMRQTHLQSDDLGRRISVNVTLALENLRSSWLGLEAAYDSVQYSELAVANERKKYRLGFSTLIDLINLQDRLTSANRVYLSNQSQVMIALAQLRFEMGLLIEGDVDTAKASARLDLLTTVPVVDP